MFSLKSGKRKKKFCKHDMSSNILLTNCPIDRNDWTKKSDYFYKRCC